MSVVLFLPYMTVRGNGTMIQSYAPTVDSLPVAPTQYQNVVLTVDVGASIAGAYQWVSTKNRWQFVIDYQTICSQIFGISEAFLCFPNTGDNLLPVGDTGQATITVVRNGVRITNYTKTPAGIVLDVPAVLSDVILVMLVSPITATTPISGGSGIPDAPTDGSAYVRQSATWANIQTQLNEGHFTG